MHSIVKYNIHMHPYQEGLVEITYPFVTKELPRWVVVDVE